MGYLPSVSLERFRTLTNTVGGQIGGGLYKVTRSLITVERDGPNVSRRVRSGTTEEVGVVSGSSWEGGGGGEVVR